MKKFLILIIIFVGTLSGVWYFKKSTENPIDKTVSTYRNTNLGISFKYPKEISVKTENAVVLVHHEVPFVHHDYCDFKGEGDTTINLLTDFNVRFHVAEKGLLETMKAESSYIPEENFVNGNVIPSPGFIDQYTNGSLSGYSIFEWAEGCGHTIYYLKISDKKTLVVTNDLITVFTGAIDTENKSKAEAVPGVINKEKAEAMFDSILKSLVFN